MKKLQELSIEIKKMCIDKGVRQKDLVLYLNQNGYPGVNAPMLSGMLGGSYNYGMASEVINKIWNYLNEESQSKNTA